VRYVNDTTATTPDGAIAALRALRPISKKIWLIAGGTDKKLDYVGLGREISKSRRFVSVLLLPGDSSEKMKRELNMRKIAYKTVPSIDDAVRVASAQAKKGDTVVLSPAATSFNQFKNEFERGDVFCRAVRRLR
jgi:UDP-N-acetylmuramoylalanine--D-glutamate ligase